MIQLYNGIILINKKTNTWNNLDEFEKHNAEFLKGNRNEYMRSGSVLGEANLAPNQHHPGFWWVEAEEILPGEGMRKLSKIKKRCLCWSGCEVHRYTCLS